MHTNHDAKVGGYCHSLTECLSGNPTYIVMPSEGGSSSEDEATYQKKKQRHANQVQVVQQALQRDSRKA